MSSVRSKQCDIFFKIAKKYHGTVRPFNQYELIKKYNQERYSGSSLFLNFFMPIIDPLPEALCYGLVSKWYQHRLRGQDLLSELKTSQGDALLHKIAAIQKKHLSILKNLSFKDQPFDRGNQFKKQGIKPIYNKCQENWIDEKNFSHSLFCVCDSIQDGPLKPEDSKGLSHSLDYTEYFKETQESPKEDAYFFGKNQQDFSKIVHSSIDECYPGSFKEIFIIIDEPSPFILNHFLGFTDHQAQNKKEYLIFDPDSGEYTFNTLHEARQFLCDYIELYFTMMKSSLPLKGNYFRVDIATHSIVSPQNQLIPTKRF